MIVEVLRWHDLSRSVVRKFCEISFDLEIRVGDQFLKSRDNFYIGLSRES